MITCCQVLNINGVNCHEYGCPESWKTVHNNCQDCGCTFLRTENRYQSMCADCLYNARNNHAWRITDWAGNVCFRGVLFSSFEEGEEFLSQKLGDKYETDRQEYDVEQIA